MTKTGILFDDSEIEIKTITGEEVYFQIIYTVPRTKKNSQNIVVNPKTKRPFLVQSKNYKNYEKESKLFLSEGKHIDYPVNIQMLFFMPTRRRVDLSNLQSACLDLLVNAGILQDDNCKIVRSHDGSMVLYDKENPRTEVRITKY